jgi:eukaryotic translation initiation factor 2-alpha kinase 1
MSNIKKDLLLCFLLEDYCKNNNYDFTTLYNKLKDDNLINISYNPLEFNTYINNLIMGPNTLVNDISNIEEKEKEKEKEKETTRLNNYNISDNIGNGSFGSVFKCINNIDQQTYALKIIKLSPHKYDTILREVRLMSTFDHPNIIKYYCSWIDYNKIDLVEYDSESDSSNNNQIIPINYLDNYYLYIQMELCKNSLNNYLEITPFDYNTRLFIFKSIVTGLNYLHTNNIIHRDLKPSNILFDKNNTIKISDFGMSIKQSLSNLNSNSIGSDLFGTYLYSSPESLTDNYYSIYSDIYSLGIILFELLNSFSTIMEKNIEINRLKNTFNYSEDFISKYKFESEFILKLIDINTTQRLITSKILSSIKILFKEK